MKRMSTDCWKTPPLLSFHVNVSAASRSARKENSTNGSRLTPEVQTKCAASWSPYITLTSLMKWAGIGFPSGSRNSPVAIGCSTSARTSITSPRRMAVGTRRRAAPSSSGGGISAAPIDGDTHIGRGAPQRAVRRFDDRSNRRRHPHLDPRADERLADLGREPELGEVDIGVVVHQQVDRLHVVIGRHRQVGLDHHGHHAPVRRHRGHIQLDVAGLNLPVAEQLLQHLLHLPRYVVLRPGPHERGQATRGEGEKRETGRVEEGAARQTRHTVTRIGSPQRPGKFAYCYPVSHVVAPETPRISMRSLPVTIALLGLAVAAGCTRTTRTVLVVPEARSEGGPSTAATLGVPPGHLPNPGRSLAPARGSRPSRPRAAGSCTGPPRIGRSCTPASWTTGARA